MHRAITGFEHDGADWTASLVCGHAQHVRHKPPFWNRAWVLTPEGRASRLGTDLECLACDQFVMPAGYVAYKRTPELDAESVPPGLLKDHSLKHGVWGTIHVIAGSLRYLVEPPLAREFVLDREHPGIVVPEVLHRVIPAADARFFVEFHRKPG